MTRFTFLTDSLELRPGWYYTYVEVNDGRNLTESIYADERIYIDMDNAPDSVEQMATLAGVEQLHRCLGLRGRRAGGLLQRRVLEEPHV